MRMSFNSSAADSAPSQDINLFMCTFQRGHIDDECAIKKDVKMNFIFILHAWSAKRRIGVMNASLSAIF